MLLKNSLIGLAVLLALFSGSGVSKAQVYQISLLTCDPGEELYSSFGHNAIRVRESGGKDLVFNYGTFDFQTPNFYGKFVAGKLDYMLSLTTYERFIEEYVYFRREVREQLLDLSPSQKKLLVQHLQASYESSDRYYKYDFFFNNCATKVRDVFELTLGKNLVWDDGLQTEKKTFRELVDEYVYPLPWSDLGIDLALGSVIDRNATEREEQYLPDYMERAFAKAMIEGDGPTRPLVKESRAILEFPEEKKSMSLLNPYLVFWALAIGIAATTMVGKKKNRWAKTLDIALFAALGLLGLLIVFLWFFTDHSATKWNWNILWAFPTHLAFAAALAKKAIPPWVGKYLLGVLVMMVLALLVWLFGFQSFHSSLIPLFLVIILRANYLYSHLAQERPGAG